MAEPGPQVPEIPVPQPSSSLQDPQPPAQPAPQPQHGQHITGHISSQNFQVSQKKMQKLICSKLTTG